MNMNKKRDSKTWMYIALGALLLSVVTLFLPIITAKEYGDVVGRYNIIGLMDGSRFVAEIMPSYTGSFMQNVSYGASVALIIIL